MKAIGRRSIASLLTWLLSVAWGVVALGLVLTILLLVLSPSTDHPMEVDASWMVVGSTMTIPVALSVDARAHHVAAPALGIAEAQLGDVRGSLSFPTTRGAFFVGNALLLLVVFGLTLWVIGLLRAVLRTLRDGQPFVAANATRIRWIACGVIAGELVRASIVYFHGFYAMTHFAADGLRFEARPDLDVFAIVLGLIILVIAEVFRAGTRLDEEQSLTV
jgi:hypothetical protein